MLALRRTVDAITWWGWALLGVGLVGAPLGVALGWRELLVMGVAALVLVALAVPWVVGQRYIDAHLELSSERVGVGVPASALLMLERPGRAMPPSAIDVHIGEHVFRIDLPALEPGERTTRRIALDTTARGRLIVGPATILRTDPFGILHREHTLTGTKTLIVHPRLVRIPGMAAGLVRDLEGEAVAELTADDVSFHSLRDYVPGDERRLVHWKSTAKSGQLLVRQFEPARRSDTLVLLSTSAADYGPGDFELALSITATIGVAAIEGRRALRVVESPAAGDRSPSTIDARSRDRLLDALADIADDRSLGIVDAARSIASAPAASVVWLVVGTGASARTIRAALSTLPPDVAPVVLRAHADAPPGVARLGHVTVVTVGVIEDLARGLGIGELA